MHVSLRNCQTKMTHISIKKIYILSIKPQTGRYIYDRIHLPIFMLIFPNGITIPINSTRMLTCLSAQRMYHHRFTFLCICVFCGYIYIEHLYTNWAKHVCVLTSNSINQQISHIWTLLFKLDRTNIVAATQPHFVVYGTPNRKSIPK